MTDERAREPCPMRIFDDIGGAFSMGVIGGGFFHSVKGYREAATGSRFSGALVYMAERAPVTGGQFAAWGGMFSMVDCTLVYVRQKEDAWNSILSGGITGAALTARAGKALMITSGAVGAVLLGMIEAGGWMFSKMTAQQFDPNLAQQIEDPSALGASKSKPPPSSSSPGGSITYSYGGGEEELSSSFEASHTTPSYTPSPLIQPSTDTQPSGPPSGASSWGSWLWGSQSNTMAG